MEGRGRREGAGTGRVSGLCHGPRERLRERHSESGRVSLSVSGSLSVFVRALGPETCECVRECAQVPQAPGRRAHAVCACRDATRELRVFARTARAGSDLRIRDAASNSTPWLNYPPELSELSPSPSRASALACKRNKDLQTEPSLWRAVEERQRDKIDNWPHSPTPIGRCFPRGPPARVVVVTRPAPHCAQHRAAR